MEDTTQQNQETTEEQILSEQKKQTEAINSIKKNVQFFSWLTIVAIGVSICVLIYSQSLNQKGNAGSYDSWQDAMDELDYSEF